MPARQLKQKAYWEAYNLIYAQLASGWEELARKHPIEHEAIETYLYEIADSLYRKSHIPINSIFDYKQH